MKDEQNEFDNYLSYLRYKYGDNKALVIMEKLLALPDGELEYISKLQIRKYKLQKIKSKI